MIDDIMVSSNNSARDACHNFSNNGVQKVELNSAAQIPLSIPLSSTVQIPLASDPGLMSDTSTNSSEPVVTIPLSYIMSAKPLLSLLVSTSKQFKLFIKADIDFIK